MAYAAKQLGLPRDNAVPATDLTTLNHLFRSERESERASAFLVMHEALVSVAPMRPAVMS